MGLLHELRCLKPTMSLVVAMVQGSTRNPSPVGVKSGRVVSGLAKPSQGPCAWMKPPPLPQLYAAGQLYSFPLGLKLKGDGEGAFSFEAVGFSKCIASHRRGGLEAPGCQRQCHRLIAVPPALPQSK